MCILQFSNLFIYLEITCWNIDHHGTQNNLSPGSGIRARKLECVWKHAHAHTCLCEYMHRHIYACPHSSDCIYLLLLGKFFKDLGAKKIMYHMLYANRESKLFFMF